MRNGVVLEIDDEVAVITINRPQARNALDLQSTDEFKTAVAKVENEDSVRAVVLTGAGGVFCSGADLREMADKGELDKELVEFFISEEVFSKYKELHESNGK